MHEMSLVQGLLQRVEEEARAHRAVAVHRVQVRIGALGGVEPELFASAYELLRRGTSCEKAELVLTREESEWQCSVCGASLGGGGALVCEACGFPARLARGGELVLERIELEVP